MSLYCFSQNGYPREILLNEDTIVAITYPLNEDTIVAITYPQLKEINRELAHSESKDIIIDSLEYSLALCDTAFYRYQDVLDNIIQQNENLTKQLDTRIKINGLLEKDNQSLRKKNKRSRFYTRIKINGLLEKDNQSLRKKNKRSRFFSFLGGAVATIALTSLVIVAVN
jgi:hypothetical protein